jgi:hypothetical protein
MWQGANAYRGSARSDCPQGAALARRIPFLVSAATEAESRPLKSFRREHSFRRDAGKALCWTSQIGDSALVVARDRDR